MPLLRTTALLEILADRLRGLRTEPEGGSALFQRVGCWGANQLAQALAATFATEARVCFLVPAGDAHQVQRDTQKMTVRRSTRLVLLLADRSFSADSEAALLGGSPNSVGILDMKDQVLEDFLTNPFTEPELAIEPGAGEPLLLEQGGSHTSQNRGRECWSQAIAVYGGLARVAVPPLAS